MTEPADCVLAAGHAGPHSDDGAPVHGGVSDPAATSGPGVWHNATGTPELGTLYTPTLIASCPRCGSDLQPDGFTGYWCAGCQEGISAREACMFDEGEPDD